VADELVAEFREPCDGTPDQQQYDEKNIRRRVYDALNVLMAMDIISKDRKEIQWKGLPNSNLNDVHELKREHLALRGRIDKKAAYLKELQDQYVGLQNLVQRNEQLYNSGNAPNGGVALPFILVQTRPHATVEVEISEDMQLVHFDFNTTPFELHDDNYVLKQMKLCGQSACDDMANDVSTNGGEGSSISSMATMQSERPSISHPVPGKREAANSALAETWLNSIGDTIIDDVGFFYRLLVMVIW
nr:transcription factor-like protein DPB isoform X1 [Tanacetum cinerariifolium]